MRTMIQSVLVSVLLVGFSASAAQLPPDIIADSYLLRAEQAVRDGEYTRAQGEINKLLDLQKEHELDLPDEFHFRYAKAAAAADLPERALESIVKYLTAAGREGQHYVEALELMNKAQDAIEGGKGPQAALTDQSPPAQAAEQGPVEAQLDAGRTPETQEVKQVLINAAVPTEAQPAPECDLWRWRTGMFFRGATVQNVKACLEAGADPNARDEGKETPLHSAVWHNENSMVIEALLAAGADPKARDGAKETPLHRAARYNKNPAVVQVLLAAGADPKAKNKWDDTPLDNAEDKKNITAIEVLRQPTADRERQRAAARKTRTKKRGGGLGAFIAGMALATTASAAGASTEDAVALGGSVITGQQRAGNSGVGFDPDVFGTTGSTGGTAGGGSCQIAGYPRPPGGVANLGFGWCPASVSMQVRSFALQAAGAQCAIAGGSSSTPGQISARRQEIKAACDRLAALGAPNCQCPPGLRP